MRILDWLLGTKNASPIAGPAVTPEQSKSLNATKAVQPSQPSAPVAKRAEPSADDNLNIFREGSSFFPSGTNIEEGVYFNLLSGQFCLVFCYGNFSPNELNDLRGPGDFGAYVEDGMLFFLYKFGSAWTWGDMTFNWWLVNETERRLPPNFTTADRILLTLCVVDSAKNELLAQRRMMIPPHVTRVIVDAILAQTKTVHISTKNDPAYVALQKKIRDRYTSEQLAKRGVIGEAEEQGQWEHDRPRKVNRDTLVQWVELDVPKDLQGLPEDVRLRNTLALMQFAVNQVGRQYPDTERWQVSPVRDGSCVSFSCHVIGDSDPRAVREFLSTIWAGCCRDATRILPQLDPWQGSV